MSADSHKAVLGTIVGVVCAAVLSGIGWILVKMFDMNSTLNATRTSGELTAQRVERIVGALPELKVKIAQEDLEKKIGLALVTKPPVEVLPGQWMRSVFLFDYGHGKLRVFQVRSQGPEDPSPVYTISGLTDGIALQKISFDDYSAAATEVGRPKPYPQWVDASASYAILKRRLDYNRKIMAQFGKPIKELDIARQELKWEQVVDDLAKRQAELEKDEH
jgi:hypothetical protein